MISKAVRPHWSYPAHSELLALGAARTRSSLGLGADSPSMTQPALGRPPKIICPGPSVSWRVLPSLKRAPTSLRTPPLRQGFIFVVGGVSGSQRAEEMDSINFVLPCAPRHCLKRVDGPYIPPPSHAFRQSRLLEKL